MCLRFLLLFLPAVLSVIFPSPLAAFVSDDFFLAGIDFSRWELVDPRGDARIETVGAGSADARLQISVPGGREHDLWTNGLNAPRLRQIIGTGDFTVEVKFESPVRSRYQTQGILAEGPEGALRFEFMGDGAGPRLYAAEIRPGVSSTSRVNQAIAGGTPLYMRVARAGSRWTQSYSHDGRTWLAGASFTTTLQMTTLGVYGGNAGSPSPEHTAVIDYVFNTAAPISPEDGGAGPDSNPPVISGISSAPRTDSAVIAWNTDRPAPGEVEYGRAGGGRLGTVSAPDAALFQTVELVSLRSDTEHWFRIRAWDSAGSTISDEHRFRTAAPSPCSINLWYGTSQVFGWPGVPQRWINLLGDVAACPDVASLSFRLNGGPERPLSIGPDGRRLASPGDFNVEIAFTELLPGGNQVDVIARDGFGQETSQTVLVEWRGGTWPLPYQIDWRTVSQVQAAVQVVDGKWQIADSRLRPTVLAYDRLVAIGDLSWQDYEVTVPITVMAIDEAGFNSISSSPGIGVQLRWSGHTDSNGSYKKQPHFGWLPVGATAWYGWGSKKFKLNLNGRLAAEDLSGRKIEIGSTWIFKLRVETLPGGEGEYRFKFWPAGQAEPAQWDLTGVGWTTDPRFGSALLVAHHVDARFGAVTVLPTGVDRTPPVFREVRITPGQREATVAWTTDEPATARVTWGRTANRTDGSLDLTSPAASRTITLTGLTPETGYYLRIAATDAAGNTAVADRTFTTLTAGTGGPASDEFDSFNGGAWTFIDPRGDATLTVRDGRASIAVPAGTEHDLWTKGIFAPRLVQTVADGDFEVAVKFDSAVRSKYQLQGIIIEGAGGFVRLEFHGDGGSTRFFSAVIAGSTGSTKQNRTIAGGAPLYLRIKRTGDTWAPFWSADGSTWTAGTVFNHPFAVTSIGVYGGNAGGNPEHTAIIDWFRLMP